MARWMRLWEKGDARASFLYIVKERREGEMRLLKDPASVSRSSRL